MAEARISDAALAREDFLRFRETGFGGDRLSADPDTAGWFSLDAADLPTTFLGANAKLQDGQAILGLSLVTPEGAAPAASAPGVVTSAVVRAASTKAPGQANAASLACLTNNGRNAYLKVAGWQGLLGGSLTQEFIFRLAHAPIVGQNSNLNSYGLCCSSFLKMLVNQANGTFLCRIKTTTDEKDVSSAAPVAVGVWHHVAFVHDAAAPRTSVYLDGVLLGTHPGRLRMSEGQDYVFAFAQDHANAPQLFDGWIDEIRLTRRALRLDEFLAFNADPGDTLARIRFDGDLSVEPYAYPGAQGRAEGYLEGCPAPAFTAPRAGATATAQEARGEPNRHALKFEGGAVVWTGLAPLARDRVTVEFFWRPYEKAAPWPVVLGISTRPDRNVPASMNNAPIPWAFAYEGTWARAPELHDRRHERRRRRTGPLRSQRLAVVHERREPSRRQAPRIRNRGLRRQVAPCRGDAGDVRGGGRAEDAHPHVVGLCAAGRADVRWAGRLGRGERARHRPERHGRPPRHLGHGRGAHHGRPSGARAVSARRPAGADALFPLGEGERR